MHSRIRTSHALANVSVSKRYRGKIDTIFDGIDTSLWPPNAGSEAPAMEIGDRNIPPNVKVVTYVSPGSSQCADLMYLWSSRTKLAQPKGCRIHLRRLDRVAYGNQGSRGDYDTYRQRVLSERRYQLDRFLFPGMVPATQLVEVLHRSDLHIYLTEPFILSWSLMDARLRLRGTRFGHGVGARSDSAWGEWTFGWVFRREGLTEQALDVLGNPMRYRAMRDAAVETIRDEYSLEKTMPKMIALYERAIALGNSRPETPTLFPESVDPRELDTVASLPFPSKRIEIGTAGSSNERLKRGWKPQAFASEKWPSI